mgnify:CR=1 FL=1
MGRRDREPRQQGGPRGRAGAALVLLLWLCGCATTPPSPSTVYDPIEPVNRAVFEFNRVVDGILIKPIAELYGLVVPSPIRTGVRNFLANLRSPIIFANDLLQGETERAGTTLGRFMINTTIGLGGVLDPATALGRERHDEDLGQTLAVWGVGDGPYLVLPILGPSNLRDLAGRIGDRFANPLPYLDDDSYWIAQAAGEGVQARYDALDLLDDLERNSLDFYAAVRAIYAQRRAADIRNGRLSVDDQRYDEIFSDDEIAPAP